MSKQQLGSQLSSLQQEFLRDLIYSLYYVKTEHKDMKKKPKLLKDQCNIKHNFNLVTELKHFGQFITSPQAS